MTAKLLANLKRRISVLELEPATGGCFEVEVNSQLLFSKLQTGEFPDENKLVAQITKLAAAR